VLGVRESEAATPGVPCLSATALATGALLPRLELAPRRTVSESEIAGAGCPTPESGIESARMKLIA
jgi:hypothetical protein